jgi:hypothetical protein
LKITDIAYELQNYVISNHNNLHFQILELNNMAQNNQIISEIQFKIRATKKEHKYVSSCDRIPFFKFYIFVLSFANKSSNLFQFVKSKYKELQYFKTYSNNQNLIISSLFNNKLMYNHQSTRTERQYVIPLCVVQV